MLTVILVFVIGAAIGSFLNVCIYRMPNNESIITPASHCPDCNKNILWYDNIPLLSFLLLGGKCRHCKKRISLQYFIVELLTAIVFVFLYSRFGICVKFFVYALVFSGLIAASFIDLKHQIIPDEISLGGIVVGLLINVLYPSLHGFSNFKQALIFSGLGMLAGGAVLYVTGIIGDLIFKKESMGGGDIKLLAAIGAFLGWKTAILVFFIAPLFGAVVGLIIKFRKKISLIPYGPFISLATFISVFWGKAIVDWLFRY